jgi:GDPmannose 4,6-dehydratase
VVATGHTYSVREFCERAFDVVGLDYRDFVRVDERFCRPAEVDLLVGDPSKAREKLGWEPRHTFSDLVSEMVEADLEQTHAGLNDQPAEITQVAARELNQPARR